ncbi:sensor histidine kinase [Occultella aeris]|uniref:histidine kinase n=1 Tax=Occultella aeris TaxID=2761496 RepID=A0A7M4DRC8_9MICO|nr:histidine kinase [Occultella aeris]VZO40022.1 Sensor histidine kinase DesK [Occultella aeris]
MHTGRELVGSLILTVVLLLVAVGSLPFLVTWGTQTRPVDAWAVVLVVVAAGSAALRRWPVVSFGICTVATSVYLMLGYPYGGILLCLAVAAYTVARRTPLRVAVVAAAAALALLLAHVFTNGTAIEGLMTFLPGSAWVVVPFSIGLARRLVVEAAQRQRAESERRALDDERLRLASEVHDVVGHGLAAIQMQADIARHVRDRKPEQADIALDAISRTSAEALAELRATLAAIAPSEAAVARESRAPTPGLARVGDLCARMRESGVDVDLAVTGTPRALDPAVDVAAYRVLQESLTNVAKHAAQRHASVAVRYTADAVEVDVANPMAPLAEVTEGFGIAGMRRRIDDVGGAITVSTGGGEFRVAAVLPG